MKSLQAAVLAVAVCFSLGATDASSRFNDLGHRLMCTCGCAQLLGECNHVGCPESGREREELSASIAAGKSDKEILAWFAAKYGATVLAAPTTAGLRPGGLDCSLRGLCGGAAGHHSADPPLGKRAGRQDAG